MKDMHRVTTEQFIQDHLATGAALNATSDPGYHSSYIVRAAKARGLRVMKFEDGHFCFFGRDAVVGGVRKMVTSLVASTAISLSASKQLSKTLFEQHGVPVAAGSSFAKSAFNDALAFFQDSGRPMVVKPETGRAGAAVQVGISTEEEFRDAWVAAVDITTRGVIVEETVSGIDIRAFVISGRVVAAASRLPAFVVGDGVHGLHELIAEKASARNRHAYLKQMPIAPDWAWLSQLGHTSESVPQDGQVVTLNGAVNLHQGGEHVDVTSRLHPGLKRIAVEAVRAIPGLEVSGIDLLVPSLDSPKGAIVLESNPGASISVHHSPAYGNPVDVGGALVEEMLRRI